MYKRTFALAAILTTGAAGAANAAVPSSFTPTLEPVTVGATSGSITTPPLSVLGDATIKLGPAGTKRLRGVKQLKVTVRWSNALGAVQPVIGQDCTVDATARIGVGHRTAVTVTYSYVHTASRQRSSLTRSFDVRALRGGPWDFGVCHDAR